MTESQTLLKVSLVVNLAFLVLAGLAFLRPLPPPAALQTSPETEHAIALDAFKCANSIGDIKSLVSTQQAQLESIESLFTSLKQSTVSVTTSCNCANGEVLQSANYVPINPQQTIAPTYKQPSKLYSCEINSTTYCEQFPRFSDYNFKTGNAVPDLCTYLHCILQTGHLFGVNWPANTAGTEIGMFAIGPGDFTFIDFVIAQHQELKDITEFGTASGITSVYLGMICKLRGGVLHTFDWVAGIRSHEALKLWEEQYMKFYQADLLSGVNEQAKASLKRSTQIAFMDNGSKKREINMYARYLPVGSIILTHDWNIEIFWEDIKDELTSRGFFPIYEKLAIELGANSRAWYRGSEGTGVET